ncbi:angiopoietin-related protein 7 [Drosophila sulfurigaster albostrigata]|uniref:angiopoietin-related protein 7 n=1 Tax=Drosophila sulfurigaster albostrigata TaxID=89887 RepID=UPI002D218969|nr:angiopoietin-related protein 7 [Drosophila sulfurigaster albostrigata]
MEWTWITFTLLSFAIFNCHCNSRQSELQRRLMDELQEFDNLTWQYIEEYEHDLSTLKVANILQELIDRNITGHLPYLRSCPDRQGIFKIKVNALEPFSVLCDAKIAGPGWIVVLKRFDGSINFFRNWKQYQQGFGDLSSEFFIGLEKLHAITYAKNHELYVHLEDFEGNTRFARYDQFVIGNENSYYKLEMLGKYTGDAGDALRYNQNMRFYTFDKDIESQCAQNRTNAGWFDYCTQNQNLFGIYLEGYVKKIFKYKGIRWDDWHGEDYSLKSVQMMIRPKCSC